jgi:hypothetical protein
LMGCGGMGLLHGRNPDAAILGRTFQVKHASVRRLPLPRKSPLRPASLELRSRQAVGRPKVGAAWCVDAVAWMAVIRARGEGWVRLASVRKAFARSFKALPITPPEHLKFRRGRRHKRSRFARDLPRFFLDSPILATYCGSRWFFVVDRGSCFKVRRR